MTTGASCHGRSWLDDFGVSVEASRLRIDGVLRRVRPIRLIARARDTVVCAIASPSTGYAVLSRTAPHRSRCLRGEPQQQSVREVALASRSAPDDATYNRYGYSYQAIWFIRWCGGRGGVLSFSPTGKRDSRAAAGKGQYLLPTVRNIAQSHKATKNNPLFVACGFVRAIAPMAACAQKRVNKSIL